MKRSRILIAIALLIGLLVLLWPRVTLFWLKQKAIRELTQDGKIALPQRVIEKRELGFSSVQDGASFIINKSRFEMRGIESLELEKTGAHFQISGYKVSLVDANDKEVFGSMPKHWGMGDLEKILYLSQITEEDLTDARDAVELKEKVAAFTARLLTETWATSGPLIVLKGDGFKALLDGDTEEGSKMICQLWSNSGDAFLLVFVKQQDAPKDEVVRFLDHLRIREATGN
ncbi:MAG: hypothetical protein ACON4K_00030 [Akkermansiaceae bacterium]